MKKVYLYVPNLIGYLRVIFMVMAFRYPFADWESFLLYYSISYILDAFDGYAARILHQGSRFGAMLDMVTDRCSTAGLLGVLSYVQRGPVGTPFFLCLLALDLASHYCHMLASTMSGSSSHKEASKNWWIKLYYKKPVLFALVTGNETCLLTFYALAHSEGPHVYGSWNLYALLLCVTAPLCLAKQIINVVQLASAAGTLATLDSTNALKQD